MTASGILLVGDGPTAPFADWALLRLDRVSTPIGELVEYRPTSDVISVPGFMRHESHMPQRALHR